MGLYRDLNADEFVLLGLTGGASVMSSAVIFSIVNNPEKAAAAGPDFFEGLESFHIGALVAFIAAYAAKKWRNHTYGPKR